MELSSRSKPLSFDPWGLTFAFLSGVFTLFSPCGFPMLPGYISYYIGTRAPIERAVTGGVVCALGLLVVFSTIGLIASLIGGVISRYISFLELVAGLITIVMGLSMIFEITLPVFWLSLRAPRLRSLIGIFLYGIVYGLATLGCSAPVFLSVLFYAIAVGGPLHGIIIFIVYATGMGLPLIIITILVARARGIILKKMVKVTPMLHRLSGIILLVIGVYLVHYYLTVFYTT